MMSKKPSFLYFIIFLVLTIPLPQVRPLGIGPPSFELDLRMGDSNSTVVYLLSDGLEGELVIGRENLPFRVEPSVINMSKEDHYRPVELTFYGNESLELGTYEGMVTFIAQTGGFVALGIKIRAKINLLGEAQEETEDDDEAEFESEEEPEIAEEEEPDVETKSEEEDEDESQDLGYVSYFMGGAVIVVLVVAVIWWKRK